MIVGIALIHLAPARRQQLHLIVAIRELATGASVQQVSADLGYESVTAFITMFRKALGKSPAKYLSSVSRET
ncbi:AraC-like DNA-binding protein [Bradyrhizobium sp. AZCC 2230]